MDEIWSFEIFVSKDFSTCRKTLQAKHELSHDGELDEGHKLPELLRNVLKMGANFHFVQK